MFEKVVLSMFTARKVSKDGVFSDLCVPVFRPNTEKYGPEKTSYLDTFHAVVNIHDSE